jgi:predicted transcriptional regulator
MRRDKIEIFADILKVAKNGAKKTHIVYKANLNFSTLKNHIKRLKEKGLLIQTDEGYYLTTQQGDKFLEQYMKLLG